MVEDIILEKDKDLYNECVNKFFDCANNYINQRNNEYHILKSKILAFISVKCNKRNSIGGLFQDCNDYLDSKVLDDIIVFLKNLFN